VEDRDRISVPFGEVEHLRWLLDACRRMRPYLGDEPHDAIAAQIHETSRLVHERLDRLGGLPRENS